MGWTPGEEATSEEMNERDAESVDSTVRWAGDCLAWSGFLVLLLFLVCAWLAGRSSWGIRALSTGLFLTWTGLVVWQIVREVRAGRNA